MSRSERRRLRERRDLGLARLRVDKVAFLLQQLEPTEVILARSGDHPMITDRRILWARQLHFAPRLGEWVCESLTFTQITGWALGQQHDLRPLIRLEHAPVQRIEHVPAHRVLWFGWGNAEGPVTHSTTLLAFGRDSNPVFVALRKVLEGAAVTQGEPFVVRPEGTREERSTRRMLYRERPWRRVRGGFDRRPRA
jgi:hypothetical protein